jgi:hypothetical protein
MIAIVQQKGDLRDIDWFGAFSSRDSGSTSRILPWSSETLAFVQWVKNGKQARINGEMSFDAVGTLDISKK